ncbi:MAG: efflux RND transporter permease subunit [Candidatus Competibacteraceae bacterium]
MIDDLRPIVENTLGPIKVSFLRLAGGPPVAKPISVKVRGDEIGELRAAVAALQTAMAADPTITDIANDDNPGLLELQLRVNQDAAQRAGLDPAVIARTIALLVDGEIVTSLQDRGETLDVRVRALPAGLTSLDDLLRYSLPMTNGSRVPLAELVHQQTRQGQGNVRHYNFRRTITVEADIDKTQTDTVQANQAVLAAWGR